MLRTPTDPDRGRVSSGWLEMFEPLHLRVLSQVDLSEPNEVTRVDLQRGVEGQTGLWIDAQGEITAEQARTFAANLLEAADRFDEITGAQR